MAVPPDRPNLPDRLDRLEDTEARLLDELRSARRDQRAGAAPTVPPLTRGQRFSDTVTGTVGSWRFILIQSGILLLWIAANVTAWVSHWDPYPFILLNLALSFQAAYTAPFILMSQNREQEIDRQAAHEDYRINIKAELEIELLHQKIDALREQEVLALTRAVEDLATLLRRQVEPGTNG